MPTLCRHFCVCFIYNVFKKNKVNCIHRYYSQSLKELPVKSITKTLVISLYLTSTLAQAEVESWYTFWGAGVSNISYSGDRGTEIEILSQEDASVGGTHLNAFGFYFPIDNNSIYGFVAHGATSTFTADSLYIEDITYNDTMLAFSYMNFYGSEIGDGLFYRTDIGYSEASRTVSYAKNDFGTSESEYEFGSGMSVLLGAGYGIPVSEESRVLILLEYRNAFIADNEMQSIGVTVNGLW